MALTILRSRPSGARLVLGTHDVDLVARIDKAARDEGIGRDAYEVHMLYGIRAADLFQLAKKGYRVRTLISYGPQWFPWFMRRMAERPVENSWLALRNVLARTEQDSRQE
jgi:proline dehydrogenase